MFRSPTRYWLKRASIGGVVFLVTLAVTGEKIVLGQESRLAERQSGVAERYQRLEELLLRLADVEATENPERAALLRRAARQSRDQFVLNKIQTASEALRSQQFQSAVENQGAASEGLQAMLKLLLSEDRSKRIRDEKERIANLIKNLKRIERAQRSTRAKAENGADLEDVLRDQKSISNRSEELRAELSESNQGETDASQPDAEKDPSDEPESNDKDNDARGDEEKSGEDRQDDPSSDQKPEEKNSQEQDAQQQDTQGRDKQGGDQKEKPNEKQSSSDGKSKQNPSESKPSESKPSESKPSESKSGEAKPDQSQPSQEQQPQAQQPQSPEQQAEERLKQAIEKMQQAEKELDQAKRDNATEKQREAEENLRQAIDRLEKILRQLREEEMQRELARLEARFRKMAAMQSQVLDDTVTLSATPASQRNRQTDLKSGELAFEEKKITLEADRAMLLLREEGSSVAFPEVVSQIRDDTIRVTERLGQSKIDAVTQGIQQDVLAALEEMIEALQKAQRDLEKQRQEQQPPSQSGGQGEQPLVQALAELKLIRTMEKRIKSTTLRYSGLLESNESAAEDVLPLLQNLSERQNRLYRITRDLVLKRNQ